MASHRNGLVEGQLHMLPPEVTRAPSAGASTLCCHSQHPCFHLPYSHLSTCCEDNRVLLVTSAACSRCRRCKRCPTLLRRRQQLCWKRSSSSGEACSPACWSNFLISPAGSRTPPGTTAPQVSSTSQTFSVGETAWRLPPWLLMAICDPQILTSCMLLNPSLQNLMLLVPLPTCPPAAPPAACKAQELLPPALPPQPWQPTPLSSCEWWGLLSAAV